MPRGHSVWALPVTKRPLDSRPGYLQGRPAWGHLEERVGRVPRGTSQLGSREQRTLASPLPSSACSPPVTTTDSRHIHKHPCPTGHLSSRSDNPLAGGRCVPWAGGCALLLYRHSAHLNTQHNVLTGCFAELQSHVPFSAWRLPLCQGDGVGKQRDHSWAQPQGLTCVTRCSSQHLPRQTRAKFLETGTCKNGDCKIPSTVLHEAP